MKFIVFILLLVQLDVVAQGFVQMNQTPLLYHPSFAGATGNGRLAWASNLTTYETKPEGYAHRNISPRISNYLSFDDLWKKKGLGWGVSFLSSNLTKSPSYPVTLSRHMVEYSYKANVYLSSKHVFLDKNGKIKYTLSPSISLGYSLANPHFTSDVSLDYRGAPYYYHGYGENHFGLWERPGNKTFQATVGLLFNSKTGYLGIAFKNTVLSWETAEDTTQYSDIPRIHDPGTHVVPDKNYQIVYPSFSFVFAKTFSFDSKGRFSFTPSGYFSVASFYKRPEFYNKASLLVLESYTLNATLSLGSIYFGIGTTSSTDPYRSVFGGFKNNRCRVGIGYSWGRGSNESTGLYELSFSYFFRSAENR